MQFVWDKRNTYRLAETLDIPTPRTWYLRTPRRAGSDPARRAGRDSSRRSRNTSSTRPRRKPGGRTRAELRERFGRASAHVGSGEVMIQDLIPGGGEQQFAYCAFFKEALDGQHGRSPAPAASAGIRPRQHVRRGDRAADPRRRCRSVSFARSTTTDSSSSNTSSTRGTGSTSCSTSTAAHGAITRSAPAPASTSRTRCSPIRWAKPSSRVADAPA